MASVCQVHLVSRITGERGPDNIIRHGGLGLNMRERGRRGGRTGGETQSVHENSISSNGTRLRVVEGMRQLIVYIL